MWTSASEPITGCWWPIIDNCSCTVPNEVGAASDQMAIDVLHALSGRQFGTCSRTIRPCVEGRCPSSFLTGGGAAYWASLNLWWSWSVTPCGRCGPSCSCSDVASILLPEPNVRSVSQVEVDGVILDPSTYRLSGQKLFLKEGSWPLCQDDAVDLGEVGSWGVTFRYGKPVPAGGQLAAGVLSCEIAKAIMGNETCELPERVQTVTRDGVTIGFVDPMDYLDNGKTGLRIVDMWLAAVNPNKLKRPPALLRPDSY